MPESFKKVILLTDRFTGRQGGRLCRGEDVLVIALCVGAKLTMEKEGILCRYPDDLVDLPDLNSFGTENIIRVRKICGILDEKLRVKMPFIRENGIRLFYYSFYTVKRFFDVIFTSAIIMERLLNTLKDAEVTVVKKTGSCYKRVESLEPLIITSLLENVFLKDSGNIRIAEFRKSDVGDLCSSGMERIKQMLFFPAGNARNGLSSRGGIILQDGHDVSYLAGERLDDFCFSRADAFTVLHTKESENEAKRLEALIDELFVEAAADSEYRGLYPGGDELFDLANRLLKFWLLKSALAHLSSASHFKERLLELGLRFALTASCRFDFPEALMYGIVKSLHIPVVTYQEGGGAGYIKWPFFNLDMELSDYFLAYGEGVKQSPYLRNGNAEIVPVGSLRLEKLKQGVNNREASPLTIFVVLDSIKTGIWQHYPYNGGFFSEAYRNQLKLLNYIRRFEGVRFIIKTVRGKEFLYERLDDFFGIETRPLSEVLGNASAFIVEYPSTVLQECLITDKPVALLYDRANVEFDPDALASLNKRVRMSSDPDEFMSVIEQLIKDVRQGTGMSENREFLEKYCLMNNAAGNLREFFNRIMTGEKWPISNTAKQTEEIADVTSRYNN